LVAQARAPAFYAGLGVPDSLDGRFEMLALHVFVALRRLKQAGHDALAQALFDAMFEDMDRSLREIGVGDLSVGKRVKEMARALYGRIAAYEAGLSQPGDEALVAALERNLYGTVAPPPAAAAAALARYLRQAAARLDAVAPAELGSAPPPWPAIPVGA
jgi:cytochrome b pre-mRNA-processing protein 3